MHIGLAADGHLKNKDLLMGRLWGIILATADAHLPNFLQWGLLGWPEWTTECTEVAYLVYRQPVREWVRVKYSTWESLFTYTFVSVNYLEISFLKSFNDPMKYLNYAFFENETKHQ